MILWWLEKPLNLSLTISVLSIYGPKKLQLSEIQSHRALVLYQGGEKALLVERAVMC